MENTTFRFICYREFKRYMGALDACVEYVELSVRDLLNRASHSEDIVGHIKMLSKKHGIKVDDVEVDLLRRHISGLYLLSAYSAMEEFLRAFMAEHPQSIGENRKSGESLLQAIIKSMESGYDSIVNDLGKLEVRVFHYYRLVRNVLLHSSSNNSKHDSKADDLRKVVQSRSEYLRLAAPNSCSDLDFDDFILLTRVCKHLAEQLCKTAKPTDREIADMMLETHPTIVSWIKQYRNQPTSRHTNVIFGALSTQYSLTELEARPIVELMLNGPLA